MDAPILVGSRYLDTSGLETVSQRYPKDLAWACNECQVNKLQWTVGQGTGELQDVLDEEGCSLAFIF